MTVQIEVNRILQMMKEAYKMGITAPDEHADPQHVHNFAEQAAQAIILKTLLSNSNTNNF